MLKKLTTAIGILIFSLIACLVLYLYKTTNHLSGTKVLEGLQSSVIIDIDDVDVPHIRAKSEKDAYFALGYLHATERSWQIEFNRRVASGELSEIFGEETLDIDRFIRTLGIKKRAEIQLKNYSQADQDLLKSYAKGINAGNQALGIWLPIEYYLLGIKPKSYESSDAVAWMSMMALDLGGNWEKELSRLDYSRILTTKQVWEVLPPYPGTKPLTSIDFSSLYKANEIFALPNQNRTQTASAELNNNRKRVMLSDFFSAGKEGIGSNNWVIAGSKTKSGYPLLANDPHLTLSAPSAWYFAHMQAPGLDVIGATLPGIPGVAIGKTNEVAWGFTNTNPDVQDLYIEKLSPNNSGHYINGNESLPFKTHQEIIAIKGKDPLILNVRESRHGPIISDVDSRSQKIINTDKYSLALRWTALDEKNTSVASIIAIDRSKSIEDLKSALRKLYAPMQNVVFADRSGNIGLQLAGVAPCRALGQNLYGVAPALGWNADNDWSGFVPFEQLPSSLNPQSGFIVTANQKIDSKTNPNPLTGDWDMPYRYERIQALLSNDAVQNPKTTKSIQLDVLSLGATPLLDLFHATNSSHPIFSKAEKIIDRFNGSMEVGQPGPLIFNAWADQLTRLVFGKKLGKSFDEDYGERGFRNGLTKQIKDLKSPWCDIPETRKVENCLDASSLALTLALEELSQKYSTDLSTWKWGNAHIGVSEHKPFGDIFLLSKLFNVETPIPGDSYTINVGRLDLGKSSNPFTSKEAPSFRVIFDLSSDDLSSYVLPTGQSGWVQNKEYRNQLTKWVNGESYPLKIGSLNSSNRVFLNPVLRQ